VKAARVEIRNATIADHDAIWKIFHEVVAAEDTYAFDPKISREDALSFWFRNDTHSYVAELDCLKQSSSQPGRRVVGTYILRPNQTDRGSHVANAAFMVASDSPVRELGARWPNIA
jgi:hypothetical protein